MFLNYHSFNCNSPYSLFSQPLTERLENVLHFRDTSSSHGELKLNGRVIKMVDFTEYCNFSFHCHAYSAVKMTDIVSMYRYISRYYGLKVIKDGIFMF